MSISLRNRILRSIVRDSFGRMPSSVDGELASDLAEWTLKNFECLSGDQFSRCIKVFALNNLYKLQPEKFCDVADFMFAAMGHSVLDAVIEGDFDFVKGVQQSINTYDKKITFPRWMAVEPGHIVLACMTLLTTVDISYLTLSS
jgi:hypothetical protein